MHPNLLSLMLFCFVTSCTPGPNNILASYSSFNFGIKKTIPHMLGVALGYTSMITILDVGLIIPFKKYPIIQHCWMESAPQRINKYDLIGSHFVFLKLK